MFKTRNSEMFTNVFLNKIILVSFLNFKSKRRNHVISFRTSPGGISSSYALPVSLLEVAPAINLSEMLFCFSTARGTKQPTSVQQEHQQEKHS